MFDKHVELLEGPVVHQEFDALVRCQLDTRMLRVDPHLSAAEPRIGTALVEIVEDMLHPSVRLPAFLSSIEGRVHKSRQ
jgi:hypothetical protein